MHINLNKSKSSLKSGDHNHLLQLILQLIGENELSLLLRRCRHCSWNCNTSCSWTNNWIVSPALIRRCCLGCLNFFIENVVFIFLTTPISTTWANFNGEPYKHYFHNRKFDVSLLKKRCIFFTIFSKIFENVSKIHKVMNFFLDCYFWLIFSLF